MVLRSASGQGGIVREYPFIFVYHECLHEDRETGADQGSAGDVVKRAWSK